MVGMARCHWQAALLHGSGWGSHNPAGPRHSWETLTRVEAEHQVRLLVLLWPGPGGARDSRGLGLGLVNEQHAQIQAALAALTQ
jgi:hypothetical protein